MQALYHINSSDYLEFLLQVMVAIKKKVDMAYVALSYFYGKKSIVDFIEVNICHL